jgi:hypothetical protein
MACGGADQRFKGVDFHWDVPGQDAGEMCQPYLCYLVFVEFPCRNYSLSDAWDTCHHISSERSDGGIDQSDVELGSEFECRLLRCLFWDNFQSCSGREYDEHQLSTVGVELQHHLLLEGGG